MSASEGSNKLPRESWFDVFSKLNLITRRLELFVLFTRATFKNIEENKRHDPLCEQISKGELSFRVAELRDLSRHTCGSCILHSETATALSWPSAYMYNIAVSRVDISRCTRRIETGTKCTHAYMYACTHVCTHACTQINGAYEYQCHTSKVQINIRINTSEHFFNLPE